jgi:hypothetical protein
MNLKENGLAWTGLVRRRIGAYDMLFFMAMALQVA